MTPFQHLSTVNQNDTQKKRNQAKQKQRRTKKKLALKFMLTYFQLNNYAQVGRFRFFQTLLSTNLITTNFYCTRLPHYRLCQCNLCTIWPNLLLLNKFMVAEEFPCIFMHQKIFAFFLLFANCRRFKVSDWIKNKFQPKRTKWILTKKMNEKIIFNCSFFYANFFLFSSHITSLSIHAHILFYFVLIRMHFIRVSHFNNEMQIYTK